MAGAEELADPDHWVRQVREAVRFGDGVAWLDGHGVDRYLELGPDGVLAAMAGESLAHRDEPAVVVAALRRSLGEPAAATAALAELHAYGVTPDWTAVLPGVTGLPVALPTYAFETEHYWPRLSWAPGDVTAAGLGATRHPLLGAGVSVADGDELLFFGWLSPGRPQWSADHVVLGHTVLPGTAFVELAVRAGDQAGCGGVEELVLETPLVLPERGGVQVQVAVGAADGAGRRDVTVYARPGAPADEGWPERPGPGMRAVSWPRSRPRAGARTATGRGSGRRPARTCRWRACTSCWRPPDWSTARPSAASGACGGSAARCSPRCPSRSPRNPGRVPTASIRRCSTPLSRPRPEPARPLRARRGSRSPSRASLCGRPAPRRCGSG